MPPSPKQSRSGRDARTCIIEDLIRIDLVRESLDVDHNDRWSSIIQHPGVEPITLPNGVDLIAPSYDISLRLNVRSRRWCPERSHYRSVRARMPVLSG
jgi:hypothetical protein